MKIIKVFGAGCRNCSETMERIETVAKQLNIEVDIEKVSDLEKIMLAGVMTTPGVSIDGQIKHSGSVPSVELVADFLRY